MSYWSEFAMVAGAHLLAVASPGPDFAVVLRQSLVHGRRAAIATSVGIGTGILLHTGYSVLGLGLVLRSSPAGFTVMKFAGAAYLAWLGVQALRAKPRTKDPADENAVQLVPDDRAAFTTGLLTNALNPKAMLFCLALFATVVGASTPKLLQVAYALWLGLMTTVWFILVSVLFTRDAVRRSFLRRGHWIDRALGVVFLGFAVSLAVARIG